ncbi:MAG: hypothetical protein J2P29_09580, partial [Actinobacteria bacterium]|nr:hypothetical protein [Actinomycetota bacterium]
GTVPDYGLIEPISLPADGQIPDAVTGSSSPPEYDRYFRLTRERPDLAAWSRSCLLVQRRVLEDLGTTSLSAEDRCDILAGCLVTLQATLERWLALPDDAADVAA